MNFLKALLLFLSICCTNMIAQNGWSSPINISANPDTTLYGFDAQAVGDGTIYVLYDDCWGPECSITELVLKKSTDRGLTWSDRQVVSDGLGTYWDPHLAVDSKGSVHVIYYKKGERRLYYITSENNWSTSIAFTEYGTQNPRIYIDNDDVVHFFWTLLSYDTLVAHRTLNQGLWSDPEIISDLSYRCAGTSVCFDEENNMHVIFEGFQSFGNFNIFYRKRGAEGWGDIELVATDSLDFPRSISIKIVGKIPHVIWSKAVSWELFNQIFWTYKVDKWSNPEAISDQSLAFDPSVAIDNVGGIHVVWMRKSIVGPPGSDSLFYAMYKNEVWSKAKSVPFQMNYPLLMPTILSADKDIYLFFEAYSQYIYGNKDLYFTSRSIISAINENKKISGSEINLRAYPNPFNSQTNIIFRINSPDRVTIKLYDILGKELDTIIDKEMIAGDYQVKYYSANNASGIYFCSITANKQRRIIKLFMIK